MLGCQMLLFNAYFAAVFLLFNEIDSKPPLGLYQHTNQN